MPPKKRNRGRLQRARDNEETPPELAPASSSQDIAGGANWDSENAIKLLKQWAWGELSAVQVQDMAMAQHNDEIRLLDRVGANHSFATTSIKALSMLGNSGRIHGNIKRYLLTLLGPPRCPCIVRAPVVCITGKPCENATTSIDMPFLLPHHTLSYWYENARDRFDEFMFGGPYNPDMVTSFWKTVVQRRDPRIVRHPMCARPDWMSKGIGIMLHGDAVPSIGVGKAPKSFDAYSWQSLFSFGTTKRAKQYIAGLFEGCKDKPTPRTGDGTMKQFWGVIIWSMEAAFQGTWPLTNWDGSEWAKGSYEDLKKGTTLAGGFFLVPWVLKGDLDYFAKGLFLPHDSCNSFCTFCPSHSDPADPARNWSNFRPDAIWKNELYTVAAWRALLGAELHWLFLRLPYLSMNNVDPDELHVFHLGTSKRLCGSVLWALCYLGLPKSASDNMNEIWLHIIESYRTHKIDTQYSSLTLSTFCDPKSPRGDFPYLNGKAAEIKDLILPLLECWEHFRPGYNFNLVRDLLRSQLTTQGILSGFSTELFLPLPEVDEIMAATDIFLARYSALANIADAEARLLWNMVPKFHYAWHWSRRAIYLNPRRSNCAIDEDFVGLVKTCVASCCSGTPIEEVPCKVMEKQEWAFHFTMLEQF